MGLQPDACGRDGTRIRTSAPLGLYDTQALAARSGKRIDQHLKLVHSQVLQNVQVRVDLAFQAFFRRVKKGADEPGYPRFKQFGRYDSITYPQYGNGVRLEGERLIVEQARRGAARPASARRRHAQDRHAHPLRYGQVVRLFLV